MCNRETHLLAFSTSSFFLSSSERWRWAEEEATFLLNTWEAGMLLVAGTEEEEIESYLTLPSSKLVIVTSTLLVLTVKANTTS